MTEKTIPQQNNITDQDHIKFLVNEIALRESKLLKDEKGQPIYTTLGGRHVLILKSILAGLAPGPDAVTGAKWARDKIGGFKLDLYICAHDLNNLRLPADIGAMVEKLIKQNAATHVLSALALIFGHWHQEKVAEQKAIIAEVEKSVVH